MNVFLNMKTIGKRKKGLEPVPFFLPDGVYTLRSLIETVVCQMTGQYNARGVDNMLIDFLTEDQIHDKSDAGKIGFGRLYSENKTDPDKAVAAALQGFEDGLFRVLIGQTEATALDEPIAIAEGDTLTFIRLTFLAGRLW